MRRFAQPHPDRLSQGIEVTGRKSAFTKSIRTAPSTPVLLRFADSRSERAGGRRDFALLADGADFAEPARNPVWTGCGDRSRSRSDPQNIAGIFGLCGRSERAHQRGGGGYYLIRLDKIVPRTTFRSTRCGRDPEHLIYSRRPASKRPWRSCGEADTRSMAPL